MEKKQYIAIDLKSFYASVECRERGLDPLTTNLVVADESRTAKTVCLAVSPSLKQYGIPGRARLFEVIRRVQEVNVARRRAFGAALKGRSFDALALQADASLEVDYVVAMPRMALYMEYSTRIYNIYLKYVALEDIHVYSIDEVFMDVTDYLSFWKMSPREFAGKIMQEILQETGITATAGIGTNLYLSKVAMDIVAKHISADRNGLRIAKLDQMTYRKLLWTHQPLTDFWRVGKGYAKKLQQNGMVTMGDVARCSIGRPEDYYNEDLLYDLFGVNAELLIDHAWGWESCTMAQIKAYRPESSSIGSGQVLPCPYDVEKGRMIVREMADTLALELVDKALVTGQVTLTVGYAAESEKDGELWTKDRYGREVPEYVHGTVNLEQKTSSSVLITNAVIGLYDRIVNRRLLVRRIYITANHVVSEREKSGMQMDLFTDYAAKEKELEREKKMQQAMLAIKKKYGKNAILKGTSLQEGATAMERNRQIGGHRA